MIVQGLPDFGQSLPGDDFTVYAPYQGAGACAVVPRRLVVALDEHGRLDFSLEYVRGANPFQPPQPHGVLDFRVVAEDRTAEALGLIRRQWPNALAAPFLFTQGFLRLFLIEDVAGETAGHLEEPIPLTWNGLRHTRLFRHLPVEGVTLLKRALQNETLMVRATAELQVTGVAPRLPVRLTFDPAVLLAALAALADEQNQLSVAALQEFWRRPAAELPLTILEAPDSMDGQQFAAALTDWIAARFGAPVPSPRRPVEPYVALPPAGTVGAGSFTWDLTEPQVVQRTFTLELDPLLAARELVAAEGLGSVFHETVVPQLATGMMRLQISTNLPPQPENVLTWGTRIFAPPFVPHRPQAIVETVYLTSAQETIQRNLRFSPAEKAAYTSTAFVLLRTAEGADELRGEPVTSAAAHLRLGVADFPLDLVPIEATADLLALADIRGVCCRLPPGAGEDEEQASHSFSLTADQPALTLALPRGSAAGATLHLEAHSRASPAVLALPPLPGQKTLLGRYSLAEYGPHTVSITCRLAETRPLAAIELLPLGKPDSIEQVSVLAFTPGQPQKTWSWFAESPFEAGFRYRLRAPAGAPPHPWSEPVPPLNQSLEIDLRPKEDDLPLLEDEFDYEGLRVFPSQTDPEQFYFLPADPQPQTDPRGRPTLLLLISGETGLLQLGTQWQASTAAVEALRQEIARRNPELEPSQIRLGAALVNVLGVELSLQDDNQTSILATSASSGMPPYSAIFGAPLTTAQQNAVIAALHGREGFLMVRYNLAREVDVSATATIAGDIRPARTELPEDASAADCRQWIDQALAAGKLTLTRQGAAIVPAGLWGRAEEAAARAAAAAVGRWLRREPVVFDAARLAVRAEETERLALPFTRVTDVGKWFAAGGGDDHIRIVGGMPPDDPQPAAGSIAVALDFAPEDAPLAFIQLQQGETTAVMQSPDFAPVTLAATDPSGPVSVKTSYSYGGPGYEATCQAAGGQLALRATDLGLAQVVFDAAARRAAGAAKGRVHLDYEPDGDGVGDSRTFYFDDGEWRVIWYLITRSHTLDGLINVEWRETNVNGIVSFLPRESVSTTDITL